MTFYDQTKSYLDLSPVAKEWRDVKLLDWPGALMPPKLWQTLKEVLEVIAAVCSAVEIAKDEWLKQTGFKVDKTVALQTAARLIFAYIKFGGITGPFVNLFWKIILNLLISTYVAQHPGNWTTTALMILKIVL